MIVMNKQYVSPALRVRILFTESLLADSLKIGTGSDEKVDDPLNIGFVKEQSSSSYNVWKDDWSK